MLSIVGLGIFGIILTCFVWILLKAIQYFTFKPYIQPYQYSKSDLPEENKTIKLLQYNCFWRPWLLHLGKIEYVAERSQFLADRLDKYDIVCLDESFHFGSNVVKNFISKMQAKGFKYIATNRQVPIFSRFVIDSGVMILSKYPIIEIDDVTYKDGCSFDQFAMKGCVYAKIQISQKQHINVFATHLQASYEVITERDFNIRSNQIKDIHYLLMKHVSNDTAPTFLLGDMNIVNEMDKEYNNMMEALKLPNYKVIDTFQTMEHQEPTIAGGDGGDNILTLDCDRNIPRTIDYVFVFESNDDNKVKKYNSVVEKMDISGHPYSQLSDHCAIECIVELK